MMGEAYYECTNITWQRTVKKVPFHLRIQLNDATVKFHWIDLLESSIVFNAKLRAQELVR
jgi:hypothetical protein